MGLFTTGARTCYALSRHVTWPRRSPDFMNINADYRSVRFQRQMPELIWFARLRPYKLFVNVNSPIYSWARAVVSRSFDKRIYSVQLSTGTQDDFQTQNDVNDLVPKHANNYNLDLNAIKTFSQKPAYSAIQYCKYGTSVSFLYPFNPAAFARHHCAHTSELPNTDMVYSIRGKCVGDR